MILHIQKSTSAGGANANVDALRCAEERRALGSTQVLQQFAKEVEAWKERFECLTGELVESGACLIGYGAAAKANTLLNSCPQAARALSVILDRNPNKYGRYTPGTHILVQSADRWRDFKATHMLILAWNYQSEIMEQMQPFVAQGGHFVQVRPIPKVLEFSEKS